MLIEIYEFEILGLVTLHYTNLFDFADVSVVLGLKVTFCAGHYNHPMAHFFFFFFTTYVCNLKNQNLRISEF